MAPYTYRLTVVEFFQHIITDPLSFLSFFLCPRVTQLSECYVGLSIIHRLGHIIYFSLKCSYFFFVKHVAHGWNFRRLCENCNMSMRMFSTLLSYWDVISNQLHNYVHNVLFISRPSSFLRKH